MKVIEIEVSFNYGGYTICFSKCIELSFVPFFGLELSEKINDEEENSVKLVNNDNCVTIIDYNITEDKFYIYVRNNWTRFGVSDEYLDEIIDNFLKSNWIREDNTNISDLKELMLKNK